MCTVIHQAKEKFKRNRIMEHKPTLPNAVASLVLGICSIVMSAIHIGLILGIVGLAISGAGNRIYRANPSVWNGYSMLSAGRTLSIIGIVLSALNICVHIGLFAFFGGFGLWTWIHHCC